jgi:hypothetical protein
MLLAAPHMLVHAVHPLHEGFTRRAVDANYPAADTAVAAGYHFHRIATANQHSASFRL